MKQFASFLLYVATPVASLLVLIWITSFAFEWTSPELLGEIMGLMLAALFLGELKQESIGKLYEAVAAVSIKTADFQRLNRSILKKIKTIRWIFFYSNCVKLAGGAAALCLVHGKPTDPNMKYAFIISAELLVIASIFFSRLWCEVNASETLLINFKEDAAAKEKRTELSEKMRTSVAFIDDSTIRSFQAEPKAIFQSKKVIN